MVFPDLDTQLHINEIILLKRLLELVGKFGNRLTANHHGSK